MTTSWARSRGQVHVVAGATFEAEYKPYSASPADDEVKAQAEAITILKSQNASLTKDCSDLQSAKDGLLAQVAHLSAKATDTDALTAQVADLTSKLTASQAQATADEAKLAELTAHLKAFTDAQDALANEQAAVKSALNQ